MTVIFSFWPWIAFNAMIFVMLLIDLLVFHRKAHEIRMREAVGWSIFWISIGLSFTGFVYWHYETHFDPTLLTGAVPPGAPTAVEGLGTLSGKEASLKYLAGYVLEKSLSVDNLFVFLVLFRYFGIPAFLQHRVLFWGILGALVLRGSFIFAGVALIHAFDWTLYVFGAVLIVTGLKMALQREQEMQPDKNPLLRLMRRWLPMTSELQGDRFVVKRDGRRLFTPLFAVLCMVEVTDVIFAVDSVPAVLALTPDPFLVYTSNILALLGLRALFFALAGGLSAFTYLHYGLALVLIFIGGKMVSAHWIGHVPIGWSLGAIFAILGGSILLGFILPEKDPEATP